jgi:hypothetical protein
MVAPLPWLSLSYDDGGAASAQALWQSIEAVVTS